jgi:hypothetical protein
MDTLSPSHKSIIRKLQADTQAENLAAAPAKTIAAMDNRYSHSSTRVALSALRKLYPNCAAFEKEMKKRQPGFLKLDESQEPTQKQRDKFMSWDALKDFREQYKDDMSDEEYFALCLYTMWEPARVDYTPMKVVSRKPRKLEEGMNYMVVGKSSITTIFHAYKTHWKYGDVVRKMPKALERVTREWLAKHPGTYLFQDASGQPWQPQRLAAAVRSPFQRIHKMDTGISMIRHAWATKFHAGQKPLKELKKAANNMMHGVLQQQAYRFLDLEDS